MSELYYLQCSGIFKQCLNEDLFSQNIRKGKTE